MAATSIWERITGITGSFFQMGGPSGAGFYTASGTNINATTSAQGNNFVNLRVADPVGPRDAVSLYYLSNSVIDNVTIGTSAVNLIPLVVEGFSNSQSGDLFGIKKFAAAGFSIWVDSSGNFFAGQNLTASGTAAVGGTLTIGSTTAGTNPVITGTGGAAHGLTLTGGESTSSTAVGLTLNNGNVLNTTGSAVVRVQNGGAAIANITSSGLQMVGTASGIAPANGSIGAWPITWFSKATVTTNFTAFPGANDAPQTQSGISMLGVMLGDALSLGATVDASGLIANANAWVTSSGVIAITVSPLSLTSTAIPPNIWKITCIR